MHALEYRDGENTRFLYLAYARSRADRDRAYLLAQAQDEQFADLARETRAVWVVRDGARVVAAAGAELVQDHPLFVNLTFCVVSPAYRGRGLQKALLEVREAWAKRQGVKSLETYAHKENQKSVRNLSRAGFVVSSYKDPYVSFSKAL